MTDFLQRLAGIFGFGAQRSPASPVPSPARPPPAKAAPARPELPPGCFERRIENFDCIVSVPSPSEHGPPWPVLVFLHGRDERKPLDIRIAMFRHGPLRKESAAIARQRFIIVAPQLADPQNDVWFRYADAVQKIAKAVANDDAGDIQRMFLAGFSYGGNGVLDLGLAQANFWAALWAVDPPRVPKGTPAPRMWLSAGRWTFRLEEAFKKVLGPKGAAFVYVRTHRGHGEAAYFAFQDADIYKWLLGEQLSPGALDSIRRETGPHW